MASDPSAAPAARELLAQLSHVEHVFHLPSGKSVPVLSDINFTLSSGELVAILGPSGCGKSTLIRIVAGLLLPDRGDVRYRGEPITGPNAKSALVFQQFALFPWMTVAQNIEQVLLPLGVSTTVRRQRVTDVITLIGLDGFEEAYPRELSGGMKQRVGMARALVVQPELLCMDEPFSQVDALTAETLRNEVINLWRDRARYPESILMVSHDIQEVAFMASRVLIMDANPGRIKTVLDNPMPYPRQPGSPEFLAFVDRVHGIITGLYLPDQRVEAAPTTARAAAVPKTLTPIPPIEVRQILGLLEAVSTRGGDVSFFELTAELSGSFTRTVLAVKAAELLGLIVTPEDRLVLTDLGRRMLASPRRLRRRLLAQQMLQLPLVRRVREMLRHSPEQRLPEDVLLEELAIQCPQEDPRRLFRILINWGRFTDLWSYQAAQASVVMPAAGAAGETGGDEERPARA